MKYIVRVILPILVLILVFPSCKFRISYDEVGMEKLEQILEQKFGQDAWYSEITVLSQSEDETLIRVKETKDKEFLKGKTWVKQGDTWMDMENIQFTFDDGNPESHFFQLNKAVSLDTLIALTQRCLKQLENEGLKEISVYFISIQSAPIVKSASQRYLYSVSLMDKSSGEKYYFQFDSQGKPVNQHSF